jgi:hypothetical protein
MGGGNDWRVGSKCKWLHRVVATMNRTGEKEKVRGREGVERKK